MPISWPAGAEEDRQAAVKSLRSAAEMATKARQAAGLERSALMSLCRQQLGDAAIRVDHGRAYNGGYADRWAPETKTRAELAELSISYARERISDARNAEDPALASALLAEVAALCSDALVYLSIL